MRAALGQAHDPALEVVPGARRAAAGARGERHVLRPHTEPHPLAALGGLRHLDGLLAGLEDREPGGHRPDPALEQGLATTQPRPPPPDRPPNNLARPPPPPRA